MFFRVVTSSVLALSLCIPLIASAHSGSKHEVKRGDVTYYYTAKGRVYAKKIDNVKYYRSSPKYLTKVYPRQRYDARKRYPYYYRHRYNTRYGYYPYNSTPYYTQYVYKSYSYPYRYYQYKHYRTYPYHWNYRYKAPRNYEYRYYRSSSPYYYRQNFYRR